MSTLRTLFAGPWVGEFGWELFCWQGRIRRLAREYDRIIVCGRPGHGYLYEDFAEYIPYTDPIPVETNMWMSRGFEYNGLHESYRTGYFTFIPPNKPLVNFFPGTPLWKLILNGGSLHYLRFHRQEFIRYGGAAKEPHDVLIHPRSTAKYGTGFRNWSSAKWLSVVESLNGVSVATIGSLDGAKHVPGTADLRGIDLAELCGQLASAKALISPCSGPIHLAALCGCPRVFWLNKATKGFDMDDMNPLSAPTSVIRHPAWDPEVDEVLDATRGFLR